MENTPYMDGISADRALLVDKEDWLSGNTLLSLETTESLRDDIGSNYRDDPALFLRSIRVLTPDKQEILLSYYFLGKTQVQLAKFLLSNSQTFCSSFIRAANHELCCQFIYPEGPSKEQLHAMCVAEGVEEHRVSSQRQEFRDSYPVKEHEIDVSGSDVVYSFYQHKAYDRVARELKIHRPDVRRVLKKVYTGLKASSKLDHQVVGDWLFSLAFKKATTGNRIRRRKTIEDTMHVKDPDIVGEFRINVQDPNFSAMFQPTSRES
jgi:hypothetical protein